MALAKRSILRTPQTALGTRKKEADHRVRVTPFAQRQHDPSSKCVESSNFDPKRSCRL